MKGLNLKNMKKVSDDEHSASFMDPSGHKIMIAKKVLPALQRKQIESLPMHMAEGGEAEDPKRVVMKTIAGDVTAEQAARDADILKNRFDSIKQGASNVKNFLFTSPFPSDWPKEDAGGSQPPNSAVMGTGPQPASVPESLPQAPMTQPMQMQPAQNSMMNSMSSANNVAQRSFNTGMRGIQEQQAVDIEKAKQQQQIEAQQIQQSLDLKSKFENSTKEIMDERQGLMNDYMANHINPKHYQENMTSGQKVGTAIGLFLGGFGQGLVGGTNPAMEMLNKQIDRDIDAQKANMDKSKTLLSANYQKYSDLQTATNVTRMNMNDIYTHKVQEMAAKLGTPQAKANADMLTAKFGMENAKLLQESAQRMLMMNLNNSAGQGGVSPALVRQLPAEQQKTYAPLPNGSMFNAGNEKDAEKMKGYLHYNTQLNSSLRSLDQLVKRVGTEEVFGSAQADLNRLTTAIANDTAKMFDPESVNRESEIKAAKGMLFDPGSAKSFFTSKGTSRDIIKNYQNWINQRLANEYKALNVPVSPTDVGVQHPMEGKTGTLPNGQRIIIKNGKPVPLG